jgi:hypothetical protein
MSSQTSSETHSSHKHPPSHCSTLFSTSDGDSLLLTVSYTFDSRPLTELEGNESTIVQLILPGCLLVLVPSSTGAGGTDKTTTVVYLL